MLDREIKERLMNKSKNDFFRYIARITPESAENMLFHIWNAYCRCKGNERDELFDFKDDADVKLWSTGKGLIDFEECRFGMQIEDFVRKEITLRYLDLPRLTDMVKTEFDSIYQYVLVSPYCFSETLVSMVIHPVIKQIGIIDPLVVGYDDAIINEAML